MNILTNCPNCGGYLNDSGRCDFCGSKVYDFVNIDMDNGSKSYVRIKRDGKIWTCPVVFNSACIETPSDCLVDSGDYPIGSPYSRLIVNPYRTCSIEFTIIGDIMKESIE